MKCFSRRPLLNTTLAVAAALLPMSGDSWASVNYKWAFLGGTTIVRRGITEDSALTVGNFGWNGGYMDGPAIATYVNGGCRARHDSVDLRGGLTGFNIRGERRNDGMTIKIALDSLATKPLCTLTIPRATGAGDTGKVLFSASTSDTTVRGIQSLWVRFGGSGTFWYNEFSTTWPPEADRPNNWSPAGVPVSGDSVDFSGSTTPNPKDTVQWDLNITLAHLNLNSGRNVVVRFDSLQHLGIDTLQVGSMVLQLGHLQLPPGFVILTGSADTISNALVQGALSAGEYTSLSVKAGLARNFTLSGGGTLVVGPNTGIRDRHMRSGVVAGAASLSAHDGWLSLGAQNVSRMGLFDVKGKQVRSVSMTHAISTANLPAGAYLLRAVAGGYAQEYRVIVGK
jgi:hypothetical protein